MIAPSSRENVPPIETAAAPESAPAVTPDAPGRRLRLAILVSHPVGYFTALYQRLAQSPLLDVKVWYACDWGVQKYHDPGFGLTLSWDNIRFDGYEHEFLPMKRRPKRLDFRSVDSPAIGDRLSRFGADAVLVHGYAHRLHWRAIAWCRRNGATSLMLSDSTIRSSPSFWKNLLKRWIVKSFYRRLDGALCVGANNRAYHESFGMPADRLFPAIFTVDWESMTASVGDPAAVRQRVRRECGIPDDAFVLIFCGKLSLRKRPGDLVAALARTATASHGDRPLYCLMAGSGPLDDDLKRTAASVGATNIRWLGFVTPDLLPSYYTAADAFVMCSEFEPRGLVVSEAAAFGLPLILSDRIGAVGAEDIARPGQNALIYPVGDINRLATHINTLARDPELRQRMSDASRAVAQTQTLDASARSIADAALRLHRLGPRRRPGFGSRHR